MSVGFLPDLFRLIYLNTKIPFRFHGWRLRILRRSAASYSVGTISNRRDLPWRRTRDPYAIWIAETMLQQTQVATVSPYYERFLRELPNVHALDRAPLRRVLALWSGLGYYRRAENLKKSAREIVRKYGGHLPDSYEALLALPASVTTQPAL